MLVCIGCGNDGLLLITYVQFQQMGQLWHCMLVSLIQQQRPVSTVNLVLYGIDWVHRKNGFGLPSEYSVVKQVTEAARRILPKPTMKKNPSTHAQVTAMVVRLERGPLVDLQVAAMIAL